MLIPPVIFGYEWLWPIPHMLAMSDLLGCRPWSSWPWRQIDSLVHSVLPGAENVETINVDPHRFETAPKEIMALCGLTFIGNAIVFHVNSIIWESYGIVMMNVYSFYLSSWRAIYCRRRSWWQCFQQQHDTNTNHWLDENIRLNTGQILQSVLQNIPWACWWVFRVTETYWN